MNPLKQYSLGPSVKYLHMKIHDKKQILIITFHMKKYTVFMHKFEFKFENVD